MITVNYLKGDALEPLKNGDCDAFVHGCNCFHTMGAGVAKGVKLLVGTSVVEADINTPYGDINKLGSFSKCEYGETTVYNLYSQHGYGNLGKKVHWSLVEKGLLDIISQQKDGTVIAMPAIGTGLAGGKFEELKEVLDSIVSKSEMLPDVTLNVYRLNGFDTDENF